jgi:hypothetical protein
MKDFADCTIYLTQRRERPAVKEDPLKAVAAAELVVKFSRDVTMITREMVEAMPSGCIIFDAGVGTVGPEAMELGLGRGTRIIRPDMRPMLAAELAGILGTDRMVHEIMGRRSLAGIPVVAGGLVGRRGDIVVDSISNPCRVVGVADGFGCVIYNNVPEFAGARAMVEEEILRKQVHVQRQ